MTEQQRQGVIAAIRALGFIGNAHYCPGCMNEFHEDRGQHESDCVVLAEKMADAEWWTEHMGWLA